ncbi:lactonase family protein [Mucilaginibacter sp. HD30]
MKTLAIPDDEFFYLLAGGYTSENRNGIGIYCFHTKGGKLVLVRESAAMENPSYLCIDRSGKFVYAVSEQENGGTVHAYTFDHRLGQLTAINQQDLEGSGGCYITMDKDSKHIFVACYQSGSLSVFPLNDDGSVGPHEQLLQDEGRGPNQERQKGPHVHAVCLSPDERFLFHTDLGTDQIRIYSYDKLQQTPLSPISVMDVKPGSGPRHLAFSKNGKMLYVVTELSGEVIAYRYERGNLQLMQSISMQAESFKGKAGGGDLQLSSDGAWLYASNRGDANEIIVFAIDQDTGGLTVTQRRQCLGRSPRGLALDPTGKYLLVANQESSNLVIFELDQVNGHTGESVLTLEVSQPSCLKFLN